MTAAIAAIGACAWCGRSFFANSVGRPRRYCSVACRTDHGHYREALPGWTARLAELEASAATYKRVPNFIQIEMRDLRDRIDGRPTVAGHEARP